MFVLFELVTNCLRVSWARKGAHYRLFKTWLIDASKMSTIFLFWNNIVFFENWCCDTTFRINVLFFHCQVLFLSWRDIFSFSCKLIFTCLWLYSGLLKESCLSHKFQSEIQQVVYEISKNFNGEPWSFDIPFTDIPYGISMIKIPLIGCCYIFPNYTTKKNKLN